MKIIDLTHKIEESMPVYPGTEGPTLTAACLYERDGFRELLMNMYTHTGTHIDAPAHMLEKGLTLDVLPVEQFIGPAMVIDVRGQNVIPAKVFVEIKDQLIHVDFVLIRTGWDKKWGDKAYFENFPVLSKEAVEYLCEYDLKGFGVDAISVDSMSSKSFEVHKILLKKNMVMVENLKGLEKLGDGIFTLSILPLNVKGADGSPVRAIGMINTP